MRLPLLYLYRGLRFGDLARIGINEDRCCGGIYIIYCVFSCKTLVKNMAEELAQLIRLAKEAGMEGPDLAAFVRDERAHQREAKKMLDGKEERERQRQCEIDREHYEKERSERTHRQHLEIARLEMEKEQLKAEHPEGTASVGNRLVGSSVPKLPAFDDKRDDMDAYLHRYEQYAIGNNWPKERWASNLSALLTGVALQVYYRLPSHEIGNYDVLKEALLRRFQLTEAGFRDRFCTNKPEMNESFSQFVNRITGYFDRWVELSKVEGTFDGLQDLLIREQALNICKEDLKMFIVERKPTKAKEMSVMAEQYLEVHGNIYDFWNKLSQVKSLGGDLVKIKNTHKARVMNMRKDKCNNRFSPKLMKKGGVTYATGLDISRRSVSVRVEPRRVTLP